MLEGTQKNTKKEKLQSCKDKTLIKGKLAEMEFRIRHNLYIDRICRVK